MVDLWLPWPCRFPYDRSLTADMYVHHALTMETRGHFSSGKAWRVPEQVRAFGLGCGVSTAFTAGGRAGVSASWAGAPREILPPTGRPGSQVRLCL